MTKTRGQMLKATTTTEITIIKRVNEEKKDIHKSNKNNPTQLSMHPFCKRRELTKLYMLRLESSAQLSNTLYVYIHSY